MSRWFSKEVYHNVICKEDDKGHVSFTCRSCGVGIKRNSCAVQQSWSEWMMIVRAFAISHPSEPIRQYLEAVER